VRSEAIEPIESIGKVLSLRCSKAFPTFRTRLRFSAPSPLVKGDGAANYLLGGIHQRTAPHAYLQNVSLSWRPNEVVQSTIARGISNIHGTNSTNNSCFVLFVSI
jgi:hypothetical protein